MHCRFDPGTTPGAFLKSVIDSVRIAQAEVLQDERLLTSLLRMPGRHSKTCIIRTRQICLSGGGVCKWHELVERVKVGGRLRRCGFERRQGGTQADLKMG